MKRKLSYRDKLLELANIYDVREIKEYVKSKKNLTVGQIELILRKNKIIIPKDYKSNFIKAIWTILIADFTMSLDNVLGVAGAAKDHYFLLVFGLILSIVLMATAATLISKLINYQADCQKFKQIMS